MGRLRGLKQTLRTQGPRHPTETEPELCLSVSVTDILECKVKWALESITMTKASGIPVELFKILKDDAVKVLHSICQQIWKTQQWPQDWKRTVFMPIPKNVLTTTQLHSSSPVRTPKLQLAAEQLLTGECWIPPKKIPTSKGKGVAP